MHQQTRNEELETRNSHLIISMTMLASTTSMLGASVHGSSVDFHVWAPNAKQLGILMVGSKSVLPMHRGSDGIFELAAPARAGDRYFYVVDDNKPVPDPVSRFLPEGVHGPTEIVDANAFRWTDSAWHGLALRDYVIYELHIGTFTREGTFDAAIPRLAELKRLGVTVIE